MRSNLLAIIIAEAVSKHELDSHSTNGELRKSTY